MKPELGPMATVFCTQLLREDVELGAGEAGQTEVVSRLHNDKSV